MAYSLKDTDETIAAGMRRIARSQIEKAIAEGKIDAKKPIDAEVLIAAGLVRRALDGIRLLAKGELKSKLEITVAGASKTAIAAVEKAGGKVTLTAVADDAAE